MTGFHITKKQCQSKNYFKQINDSIESTGFLFYSESGMGPKEHSHLFLFKQISRRSPYNLLYFKKETTDKMIST